MAARGSGSVYRAYKTDSDGNRVPAGWIAQVRVPDTFKKGSKLKRRRAKTKEQAELVLKEMLTDSSKAATGQNMRVVDYLDKYTEETLPGRDLADSTKDIYKTVITNPLKPTLEDVTFKDFPDAVKAWLVRLNKSTTLGPKDKKKRPLSGAYRAKAFHILSKILDEAVEDGYLDANPLNRVDAPSIERVEVPVTSATDFDDKIMPELAGRRIEPLVIFLGFTGARLGEALGLRWSDVDLKAGTAVIRRSGATTDRTKTKRNRAVPLVPAVVDALKARRSEQRKDRLVMGSGWQGREDLVFTSATGSPMDSHNARREFKRVLKKVGVTEARPFHALRHGLATRLLKQSDVPMQVVKEILGHSKISMTVDTYGHLESVVSADYLDKALSGVGT